MATFTVRNVPDAVHAAITRRARKHNRSAEAEIRNILASAVASEMGTGFGQSLRARWGNVLGEELSDLRDQTPAAPPDFE